MWLRGAASAGLALLVVLAAFADGASADFTDVQTVVGASGLSSTAKSVGAVCPAGKKVVGVGGIVASESGEDAERVFIDAVRPGAQLNGATVRAREEEGGTAQSWRVFAYAICAPAPAGLQLVTAASASSSAAKSVVAACPTGKRLLGTGGEVTGPAGQLVLDGLLPDLNLTRATVNALEDETGATQAWTVTAYAICSNPVRGLQRIAATSASDSATARPATATCPTGRTLISAAATINSASGQVMLGSLRLIEDPASAIASAHEDGTGNASNWSLTAYAICAAGARRVSTPTPQSTQSSNTFGWAGCPQGTESTGFGGNLTGAMGKAWLRWLRTNDDVAGAEVLAATTYGNGSWTLTTHAVCRTRGTGTTVVSAVAPLDATASKTVTVTCPNGTRVVGAGGQGEDTGGTGENQVITLQAVRPDSGLRSVTVTAQRSAFPGPFAWQPRAWAICAPAPAGLERVAARAEASDDDAAYAMATCPPGKHLTGLGGEIVNGGEGVGFDDLAPDAALTHVSALAASGTSTPTNWWVTAYGICVNR